MLGAFNRGGNPIGHTTDVQNTYKFQNYTSIIHGVHAWRFGAQLRSATEVNTSHTISAGNRRHTLKMSMQIRNLTNRNKPGPIIGNITSPLFGMANQPAGSGNAIFSESANNRRFELQTRITF